MNTISKTLALSLICMLVFIPLMGLWVSLTLGFWQYIGISILGWTAGGIIVGKYVEWKNDEKVRGHVLQGGK